MTAEILIHNDPLGVIAIRGRQGAIEEIGYELHQRPNLVGNIYLGRVDSVEPATGGAFIELGADGRGYLPRKRWPKDIQEGQAIAVEVDRPSAPDKLPRLKRAVTATEGATPPSLLRARPGLAERMLRENAGDAATLTTNDGRIAACARDLGYEAAVQTGHAFFPDDLGFDTALDAVLSNRLTLPNGGDIVIEQTAALTAIDVNSGKADHASGATNALAVNMTAADLIARQLWLRNLSGIIVVDMLRLRRQPDRRRVLNHFADVLDDRCSLGGYTSTGLIDLTRQADGPALDQGFARLVAVKRAVAELTASARPGRRYRLIAAPAVITALEKLRDESDGELALILRDTELATMSNAALTDWRVDALQPNLG